MRSCPDPTQRNKQYAQKGDGSGTMDVPLLHVSRARKIHITLTPPCPAPKGGGDRTPLPTNLV